MDRRRFLQAGGAAIATGLVGCAGREAPPATTTDDEPPTTTEAGPQGIYVQSFRERMSMQGTATSGDYGFALMFTVPHTFWTVTGDSISLVEPEPDDAVHLMASVWDHESRTVLPETGLSVEITRDDAVVSQEVIYPMLSQPMGFHYGGNFRLDGDGTYTVTLRVGGTTIRRIGAFADRFAEPATANLSLEFTPETRAAVGSRPLDAGGQPGALRPMSAMATPKGVLPAPGALPGTTLGSVLAGDARFVVTTLPGEPYLAVSARTRYNGYVLPAMALEATLERDGETVYDGPLERTLGPEMGYHYGAAVEAKAGDRLALRVPTPPQTARHEGYERALLSFGEPTLTL